MSNPNAHHVGLTVSDLDRALEFYRDTLGFPVLDRFEVSGEAFADVTDIDSAAGSFVHLDAGDVRLELVEYEPMGADHTRPDINQPGAAHLALAVEDADAAFEALPESVEQVGGPRTTDSGTRLGFVRDPDGNLVELLEA
ncbi:VOC family protein [Natronomonas halophila]|uniref:VOC family protein n=1 Tax=Natronomonas halophila TaxID=2747817 RepID=UPI0015B4397D|nr:VOC family protein [Natronomonas halophila]QLD84413.1 VOC family protein [Natronomonas halophila]